MTRITTTDQVLLLLRERLQRSTKSRDGARAASTDRSNTANARPLERARALAALQSLSEDDVRKTVLRGLLADEFGEAVSNDPGFQAIADDVMRLIAEMPGGPALLDRAVEQLRGAD